MRTKNKNSARFILTVHSFGLVTTLLGAVFSAFASRWIEAIFFGAIALFVWTPFLIYELFPEFADNMIEEIIIFFDCIGR